MNNTNRYPKDLGIRVIAATIGAYIVTQYGGDLSLLALLLTRDFYIEFGTTLLITFIVIQLIYTATVLLDRRFDWHQAPGQRILLQALLGVSAPTLLTFLLAALYFAWYNRNILDTNYHLYALPFIMALITMVNLYYYIRYLLAERAYYRSLQLQPARITSADTAVLTTNENAPETEQLTKSVFIARTPTRSFPVPITEIAYFYRTNNVVYLRLFSGQDHLLAISLDTIEIQLDRREFFRVARHMIVNYAAVLDFYPESHGKLGLTLNPPIAEEVTVSKLLAKSFKAWMQRLL
jgi:DNA-binding LytR/AlgR family response regulator